MGIVKARAKVEPLPAGPPAEVAYKGETLRFRRPAFSEFNDAEPTVRHIQKHYPGLPGNVAVVSAVMSRCYHPDETEADKDIALEFAQLYIDNEYDWATLDAAFAQVFPEWGNWLTERYAAKNDSGEPAASSGETVTSSGS